MAIADELIALLGFELSGEGAAKRYEATLDKLTKRVTKFGKIAGWAAAAAGTALAGGLAWLGKATIGTAAQFETFQTTLETIEGSAEAARKSLDWIADFAKVTPYDVEGVTRSFVKLKAYGIDPIANDTLRILGDTASAMGKSLDQAVEMFADASTMEFERLKEFGIKAKQQGDEVTFSWSKNGKELTKTVKKSSTEVRAFLLDTLGDRFSGAMVRQSKTWAGMMANLGDSWTDFQRRIGEAGFFEAVKNKLADVLDAIDRLTDDGSIERWATTLSNGFTKAVDIVWAVAKRIASVVSFLNENFDKMRPYIYAISIVFGLLIAQAFPLTTAFLIVALAVDDFISYLQGGESYIGDFIDKIKELTGISDEVAKSLAGLGTAVAAALFSAFVLAPIRTLRGATGLLGGLLKGVAKGAFLILVKDLPRLGLLLLRGLAALAPVVLEGAVSAFALISNPIGWGIIIGGAALGLIYYFWDDLVKAWAWLKGQAIALFNQLKDWLLGIDWTGVGASLMNSLWDGMKSIGSQIKGWFASLLPEWAQNWLSSGEAPEIQLPQINVRGNADRVSSDRSSPAAVNDNRNISQTNNVTVNQQVTQAVNAPAAAAQATGRAVSGAVTDHRSQIETEPSF